ncbi:leucyl aminopeptidase [Subtercola sp. Z020]|nr:leucyl aminopeptidase [Subtercola sp. Z020]
MAYYCHMRVGSDASPESPEPTVTDVSPLAPECTARPVFSDERPTAVADAQLWQAAGFSGALGQTLLLAGDRHPRLLVGLGERSAAGLCELRDAAAAAARRLRHLAVATFELDGLRLGTPEGVAATPEEIARAAAEGVTLGAYTFTEHKQKNAPAGFLRETSSGTDSASATDSDTGTSSHGTTWSAAAADPDTAAGWAVGAEVGRAVNVARDLVNEPANVITPSSFAARVEALAAASGIDVAVSDEAELERLGLGGVLAVGRGSVERPLLLTLTHNGHGGPVDLCLVGKGVTFDTGGLSLKSADGMIGMKHDMAGAAAAALAMTLLQTLAPNLHVKAFLPMVENMPGPFSTRPGDIVTMRGGTTVEILNTDFEGRLILGDAIALAADEHPAAIVDLATLTYAIVHALGDRTAGVFSNDDALLENLQAAAVTSDEQVWHMPMPAYLETQVDSLIADIKNFPGVPSSRSSTAAMFLQRFVPEGQAWAHLDIAGPAWAESEYGVAPLGATGFGVRLLAELFERLA